MDTRCILNWCSLLVWGFLICLPTDVQAVVQQPVPSGYRDVAIRHDIPPESLYSVALAKTSMAPKSISSVTRVSGTGPSVERPWPWTINVAGKGYYYGSRLQAWEALQVFLKRYPRKRIDVGIAQVNLGWSGHHFTSTWEAFEPYTNLNAAAAILRACYDHNPGSWLAAAGCYHHPGGAPPAVGYKATVRIQLTRISTVSARPGISAQTAGLSRGDISYE